MSTMHVISVSGGKDSTALLTLALERCPPGSVVPIFCDTGKVPLQLQYAFDVLMDALVSSGKPVLHFGLTKGGDPKHPLMLGYGTQLQAWCEAATKEGAQQG